MRPWPATEEDRIKDRHFTLSMEPATVLALLDEIEVLQATVTEIASTHAQTIATAQLSARPWVSDAPILREVFAATNGFVCAAALYSLEKKVTVKLWFDLDTPPEQAAIARRAARVVVERFVPALYEVVVVHAKPGETP